MIVVKVELWPHGYERNKQEIGRMTITNRGDSDNPKRGNYTVKVMRRGSTEVVQKLGEVLNHPRKTYSIWKLIQKALASAVDGEVIDDGPELP